MQPQSNPSPSMVESNRPAANSFIPPAPGAAPVAPGQTPLMSKAAPVQPKKDNSSLIKTIAIVVLSLTTVVFFGLFIWKFLEWDSVKTDVDGQIDAAVALAKQETTTAMEEEFLEREKYPYKDFSGPIDYGSLSFEYPKTWSVYIAKDATKGGDFEAYFNPGEIEPVSSSTINALRVTIKDSAFDSEVKRYESNIRNGKLSLETRNVGGTLANVYTGELPTGGLVGIVAMFKLRDKTVFIQTDAELFSQEFYKLLDTVTFVE